MIESIFVRAESFPNEYRAPLVPQDIHTLVQAGIHVYIQKSPGRFFQDTAYADISGCIVTAHPWTHPDFKSSYIIGIKELTTLESLDGHTHVYFSHALKGQVGSEHIRRAFSDSKSQLYDFEYFTDSTGVRLIAFGWYAGVVGAALGLHEYALRKNESRSLEKLTPWASLEDLFRSIPSVGQPRIAVVGGKGRCGQGVCYVLNTLGLVYTLFSKQDRVEGLEEFDIVYNCILLDESYTNIWLSEDIQVRHPFVVVDISCDYSKPNNPIQLYKQATTWAEPVVHPVPNVSVIAIENLPSLLPKESSIHFSACLVPLLLNFPNEAWERARARARAIKI
jgi:saccharopine dehydrogenase (NAD+, L-lysine-forming)